MPVLQPIFDTLPCLPQLLRAPVLQIPLAHRLSLLARTFLQRRVLRLLVIRGVGRRWFLPRLERHVHLLHAAQIGHRVGVEAARQERARGIAPGEEVVRAAGSVRRRADADVVNGAIDGEVDGLGRVGAVVGFELVVGEVNGSVL